MNMNLNHEEHKFIIRRLEQIHLMSRTNSLDVQYVDLHYLWLILVWMNYLLFIPPATLRLACLCFDFPVYQLAWIVWIFCEDQKYYESFDHSSAYLNSWAGQHADCTIVHCIEFSHVHHAISEWLVTSYYYWNERSPACFPLNVNGNKWKQRNDY